MLAAFCLPVAPGGENSGGSMMLLVCAKGGAATSRVPVGAPDGKVKDGAMAAEGVETAGTIICRAWADDGVALSKSSQQ